MSNSPTSSDLFLVSGGAKGITADCIIQLAKQAQCKFILLGRSPFGEQEPAWAADCTDEAELKKRIMQDMMGRGEKPTPMAVQKTFKKIMSQREISQTLSAIQQAGGQAEYLSLDITDSHALEAALPAVTAQLGPITGIVHGAGVLADKLIEKKTEQDFEAVYCTKVKGLETMLRAVPPSELRYLVLFSSVAGFFGNLGQADYAIANEILNKISYRIKHQYPNCHVVAINWGPWDAGMVTAEIKKAFTERGVEIIPIPVGARIFVNEFRAPQAPAQTVVGNGLAIAADAALNAPLRTYHIRRQLSEAQNPFLRDHMIGQHAVLPTACALGWLASAAEQRYPGYTFSRFEGLRVFKGVVFDETLADEYLLALQEVTKNETEIVFAAKVSSEGNGPLPMNHYAAQLTLLPQKPEPPRYLEFDLTESHPVSGEEIYRTQALFHGPSFQGVSQVLNIDEGQVTLRCNLPPLSDRMQGQFPAHTVNPYLTDIMLQSMVIWVGHFQEAGSLPLECQAGEYYQPLPFGKDFYVTMLVKQNNDLNLVADIIAHDQQGQMYAQLFDSKVTISKQLNRLTAAT